MDQRIFMTLKEVPKMLSEVAPPGFGHTKGDKEKGVKKGGTAAAFDRARKEGRFKGSKSDMFAIMWSQKNKGDKPHYKPGTDKKYKKYQKEEASQYEKLKKKIGSKKMHNKPVTAEDVEYTYPNVRRNRRFSTGSKMSMNPTGGIGRKKSTKNNPAGDDIRNATYNDIKSMERKKEARRRILASKMVGGVVKKKSVKEEVDLQEKAFADFYKKAKSIVIKKKEEKKPEKAMDAGAKARRVLKRKEHAKYVSGSTDNVPDDIRDHKEYK